MAGVAINDVLELPIQDRLRFVQQVWESISSSPEALPVTDAEKRELDRRLEAHATDPKPGRSWDEVKARLLHPKLSGSAG
jgi:putative addiction module component (TIGR02574 family)